MTDYFGAPWLPIYPRTFAIEAPRYRALGLWPRPITFATNICPIPAWRTPDTEIDSAEQERWLERYAEAGIGLLLGSPFPDGTTLGAVRTEDTSWVDHTELVKVGRSPVRLDKLSEEAVFFVRVRGDVTRQSYAGANCGAIVFGELMGRGSLVAIPPTVMPHSLHSYRWFGPELSKVHYSALEIVDADLGG
jgi:hypothetical protein